MRSRHVARADRESSTVLLSSDDEDTPKSKAKTTKRASVRQRKKEKSKSPVRRTKQAPTDKEEKKQQEEEKEQPLPQVEKPLPAKLQEGPKEETKPRQPTETSTSVTAGLSARTYDLRSAHRRQATSRLAGLEISSDEDETSIAGSTPTQRSTVQSRMTLSESKFRSRLSKIQSGQTTVPLDSSPSVTRRLQFTSTISKEPEEEIEVKEEEQVSTSGTVEQSSHAGEAIVPSGSSEELEERVPAWMQIARAEVGFAVLVTLFGIVGYFCYYTDHCSHFYH